MMTEKQLLDIYKLLFDAFGPQHWWPGETQFEIIVGAILTQNTNWTNVEKAIANLKSAGWLSPEKLHKLDASQLAELIRPAGYFNIKAKRLKNFLDWLFNDYEGQLEELENINTSRLRTELLSINGIGYETADSILLYAFDREIFVVDAYTARVAVRHGLIEPDADYEQLRELFQSNLPPDTKLFNEYHALLVKAGKDFCRPNALCSGCPLENLPTASISKLSIRCCLYTPLFNLKLWLIKQPKSVKTFTLVTTAEKFKERTYYAGSGLGRLGRNHRLSRDCHNCRPLGRQTRQKHCKLFHKRPKIRESPADVLHLRRRHTLRPGG
jgi:endonuclease-3 related protein